MPEYKNLGDLLVEDIYQLVVGMPARASIDATLEEVVEALNEKAHSRKVYVVEGDGRLAGTVTLEAVLRQVGYIYYVRKPGVVSFFKFLRDILKDNVSDFMVKAPVKVTKKDRVLDALELMVTHHLNDLPVVDENGVLIGELNGAEILMRALKKKGAEGSPA